MLLDLTPTAAEFGMVKDAAGISTMEGPGAFDTAPHGNWNNAQSFWPDKLKIVRTVDPDFELPEDMDYSSSMTNLFGVEGECLTGVGLWSKVRNMYHWVAYAIPAGSTRFRANLYVTDDPDGWARPMSPGPDHKNQQFEFTVDVDGQEVLKSPHQRLSLVLGSGTKLADINIPLPAGAQTIRFRVLNSAWGDGNSNTELVIHDGVFER